MKQFIKSLIPPILLNLLYHYKNNRYGWFGNYTTWEEAKKASSGYDSEEILKNVKTSLLKVKSGEAVYERDSVLFNEIEYSWPLLSGLMLAAAQSNGKLNVLDFGGSLGSTYYQNKKFLDRLNDVSWNIVEQKHFVDVGKLDFESKQLHFYYDITTCIHEQSPNILILSSILHYIEEPYKLIDELLNYDFDLILIDRTTLTQDPKTRLAVQRVSKEITGASYPIWLFNEKELKNYFFSKGYTLIESFFEYKDYGNNVSSKGYIYEKTI